MADGETPTPTPPDQPLFLTSTPAPTQNSNCPNGQPIGMYTTTPNAVWLDKCYACITPTLSAFWATKTLSPWETPLNTSTPVAPTPTITPTPYSSVIYAYLYRKELNNSIDMQNNTVYSQYLTYPSTNAQGNFNIQVRDFLQLATYRTGFDILFQDSLPYNYFNDRKIGITAGNVTGGIDIIFDQTSGYRPGETIHLAANASLWKTFNEAAQSYNSYWKFDVVVLSSQGGTSVDFTISSDYYQGSINGYNLQRSFGITRGGRALIATPTPQATPTQSSYCNVVEGMGGGVGGGSNDSIFSLPQITVGWARCLQFGGWIIPLEWIGTLFPDAWEGLGWPDTWGIPAAQLCFVPLNLGKMNLFGMSIDMDVIAFAIGAIALLRIITRSAGG